FPSRGHVLIFDQLDRQEIVPPNPTIRSKPWYKPAFEIHSSQPEEHIMPVLMRVASAAFRRPVAKNQIQPYLKLFKSEIMQGSSIEDALKVTITALFCSTDFLYFHESPGQLDDHALANRLSYFLTRTSPDQELLSLAAAGMLRSSPDILIQQTQRLLKNRHHKRFITDFTNSWLNLREINFTIPDKKLFPEYDPFLQWSMLEETRSFIHRLLADNLGVVNLVKSDFAMLNNRLAEHYGIRGVEGPHIRPVTLPTQSVRGGLLSQASILKVSANGTNTSPVVRGLWVMERLLGEQTPPPPPGIPSVEPDIRGALTLREMLERHRSDMTCNTCHRKIDPLGFALESFDPIGGWREQFRTTDNGERVNREIHGVRVRYQLGLAVDDSGVLPDGRFFDGYQTFRNLLAEDPSFLARVMTSKLLTFATGREMGFSDWQEIDRIVQNTKSSGYGLRDILYEVVVSSIFRSK
ncbi:MAG: DUF1592 domain-containing protein, partial [Pirellulales bacterium]